MNSSEQKAKISELLMTTGKAHHQAFIETDGADPDWALWYGNYLKEPRSEMVGSKLSPDEIAQKLVSLDREFNAKSPSEHWTGYYADRILESRDQ